MLRPYMTLQLSIAVVKRLKREMANDRTHTELLFEKTLSLKKKGHFYFNI
jgi:hypothetical protein